MATYLICTAAYAAFVVGGLVVLNLKAVRDARPKVR
jgi:hypothetical protein